MNYTDYFAYQNGGRYKPGKTIVTPGRFEKGAKLPDSYITTGFNILNNDALSEQLLSNIRAGINLFHEHMDTLHGVSVMTKYYQEMIDSNGTPLNYDRFSEKMIPAVYQTVIHGVIKNDANGTFPLIANALGWAKELCWDWMCRFWYEDAAREVVAEEYGVDYITRAQRVLKDFVDLTNEIGTGIPIVRNDSTVKDLYITNKNNSLSKAVTMTDILAGKGPQGQVAMPEPRDYDDTSGLYPDVMERFEADARNEQRRLESQARGKNIAKAIAESMKVNENDRPMNVSLQMHQAEPIVIKTPIETKEEKENTMMFGTQQQAPQQQGTTLLVNHMNQPITTMNGQTVNVPVSIYQHGGAVMQKVNAQGVGYYDNSGLPIVVLVHNTGQEQFIELAPGQTAYYQQILQSEQAVPQQQQQPNGLIPPNVQQQQAPQQQQQQQAAPQTNAKIDPDAFPGAELLGMTIDKTPVNPRKSDASGALAIAGIDTGVGVSTDYAPATASEPVSDSGVPELGEDYRFYLQHNEELVVASFLSDERFVSREMQRAYVLIPPATHVRCVAYVGDEEIEFIANRERFMNREKHLGYVLDSDYGEYMATEVAEKVAENTMACIPEACPVNLSSQSIYAGDKSVLMTEAMFVQRRNPSVLQVSEFEMRALIPVASVSDDTWDQLNDQESSHFNRLFNAYNSAVSNQEIGFAQFLISIADLWITDVIYNRFGVPRSTEEQIGFFSDMQDYYDYLQSEGKWADFEEELANDWSTFFSFDTETLTINIETPKTESDEVADEEVAAALDGDVEKVKAPEQPEEETPADSGITEEAMVQQINGHVAFIEELALNDDAFIGNGAIDPITSGSLWANLKACFDLIGGKSGKMTYLFVGNGHGKIYLFGCNDAEFGYIRLISEM